jgi:transcriptional regulator with XRE-family HTH domain
MPTSANSINNAISAPLCRAARALVGWSQDDLAAVSGVPKRTIARLELGEAAPQHRTSARLRFALERAGVEFIAENGGGPGVRLRKGGG